MDLLKRAKNYATIQTPLLIKADRINARIHQLEQIVKNRSKNETITTHELEELLKAIQMIIYQELNIKGKEEWKWDYISKKKNYIR